ncbi:hypothetical protein RFI_33705 [Reticulomyxa filosa]|uniref:Uncharacterized protein n=1 Tax=Reticulomyxa filosa TaxID=46433 RepID=X6LRB8_RETFI|nr:hypothetical protein RFI_33705 [Reticulomyxa filosa]|eukprot:ETO03697.1 hypothetical protein RFI_33705 [Reticulomyxa filosa]
MSCADILNHYAQNEQTFTQKISELENLYVGSWAKFRKKRGDLKKKSTFIACCYNEKVFDAVKKLNQFFIHRMPITKSEEKKSIIGILNYSKILRFIIQQVRFFIVIYLLKKKNKNERQMSHITNERLDG